jgi:hypothetical protein
MDNVLRAFYGKDGRVLSCDSGSANYGEYVDRSSVVLGDWCSLDPDFTLGSLRSLAQCPGSLDYEGLPKQPRLVGNSTVVSTTIANSTVKCGDVNCNGKGYCTYRSSPIKCSCYSGFWGSSCQFSRCCQGMS